MNNSLIKILEERRKSKDLSDTETTEKGMGWVPFGVYSFQQFEVAEQLQDLKEEYNDAFDIFLQIADNIMYERPENYIDLMVQLTKDFSKKLIEIRLQEGSVLKSGSVALFKSNGQLQWVGVPTNKFQDRQKDILSDAAHKKFVKMLKSGEAEMPVLFPWHTGEVGITTWVDYDDRGFLVAGGVIHKQYEDFVINLITNTTEPLGMSHGMWNKDIKRDKNEPNVIIEYKSFEFSFLPHSQAANLLTSFKYT